MGLKQHADTCRHVASNSEPKKPIEDLREQYVSAQMTIQVLQTGKASMPMADAQGRPLPAKYEMSLEELTRLEELKK